MHLLKKNQISLFCQMNEQKNESTEDLTFLLNMTTKSIFFTYFLFASKGERKKWNAHKEEAKIYY